MAFNFQQLKGNFFGGATAAIVALPLALAFGVASGLGALAGLYGAICVGFFASLTGGTAVQISGPTGPMTVVMAALVTQFSQNLEIAFTIVMLAGLFQIGFGLAGFGRFIKLVPQPVVSGFMTGIGIIVIILQLAPILGQVSPPGTNLIKLLAVPAMLGDANWQAVILGGLTFLVVSFTPKKLALLLPPPLLAIIGGTLAGLYLFPAAPVIGEIPSGLPQLHFPALSLPDIPDIIRYALSLAFLGSIDSLLTSLVSDSLTRTQHDSNRELMGQGLGNLVAGFVGGIAGAGATMRTLVNIRAGGTTRSSGVIHALTLLLILMSFSQAAGLIPLTVLAGILLKVGLDIIDWRNLKRLTSMPRGGVVIMLTTLIMTVVVDLIEAVAVGIVMASVMLVTKMAAEQMSSLKYSYGSSPDLNLSEEEAALLDAANERIVLFQLSGPLSFASIRDISRRLTLVPQQEVLILDLSQVPFIDSSAAVTMEETTRALLSENDMIVLFGVNEKVMRMLNKTDVVELIGTGNITHNRLEALKVASNLLQ